MRRPLKGLLLGVVIAVIAVGVITLVAGSDSSVWWWPVVLVFGAVGGGVIGALVGEEAAGESPDESYSVPD